MKKTFLILVLALAAIFTGCEKDEDIQITEKKNEVVAQEESKSMLKSGYSVPYLSQIDPNWPVNNYNCGQACVTMAAAYYGIYSPYYSFNYSRIVEQNQWLMSRFPYAGFNTGTSTGMYTDHLKAILQEKHGLTSPRYYYNNINQMISDLANGKLCIASVRANSKGLVASSYGDKHWVLVTGYDAGEFIINDPWNNSSNAPEDGIARRYSLSEFVSSWSYEKIHIPVSQ